LVAEEPSCHRLRPWREREPGTVEGVDWALLGEAAETLWDLLLRAVQAAMAVGEVMVVPVEERALVTP